MLRLPSSSDNDYYKVRTNKFGVLTVSVSGTNTNMQTRVYVINADGSTFEGFRDAAFAGDDISLDIVTQYVGVFYIRVQNIRSTTNSSPYNLKVSLDTTDEYEYNNTIVSMASKSALNVSFDETKPTVINGKIKGYYYVSNGANYNFSALTPDQDFYKFTTGSKMGVLVMRVTNSPANLRFRIEMYKDDGVTQLGYRDAAVNGDTLRLELLTQYAGVYYLRFRNNNGSANGTANSSNTPYSFSISLDTIGGEYNDNIAAVSNLTATALSLDEKNPTVIKAKLRGYSYVNNGGNYDFSVLTADQDYYKVTTGKNKGAIVMKLANVPPGLRFRIEMIKDDGLTLLGYRDAAFNGDTLRFELLTQYEGVYYVRLRNVNGFGNASGNTSAIPYTLNISVDTLGSEFNNDVASVSAKVPVKVSLDESNPNIFKGKIRGYYYVNNGGNFDFANLTADQDFYKITTTSTNGVLVMRLTGAPTNLRFRVEMIKDDGITSLGYRDANINGDSVRFELLTQYAGVYYVRLRNINNAANGVNNSSALTYTLSISQDTLGTEFNDNIALVVPTVAVPISLSESSPTVIRDRIRGFYYVNNAVGFDFANLTPDQDIYKITTGSNVGALVLKLASVPSNLRFRLEIIKDDGVSLLGFRDASVNGDTTRFELLTQYAGVYYIRLRNVNTNTNTNNTSITPYVLNVSLDTLGREFNDVITDVSGLVPMSVSQNESSPSVITGKIRGFYYVNNGGSFDLPNLTADQDLYKITTGSNIGVLVLKLNPSPRNLKMRVELIKEDGITSLGYRDAVLNGDSLRFEVLLSTPGVHYLRIRNVNGNVNGSGNSGSSVYTLKMHMETGFGEFNDALNLATPLNVNDTITSKIKGHYRTNFGTVAGSDFFALTTDADFYVINKGCYYMQSASITDVPSSMKLRITAYDTLGVVLGSKTATNNGDKVVLLTSNLSRASSVKYFKVESVNTANDINTSSALYTFTTSFMDTLYGPFITPHITKPCKDSIVVFTSSSPDNNRWSTGETTRTISYKVTKTEAISLRNQNATGCNTRVDFGYIQLAIPPFASFTYQDNFNRVIAFTSNSLGATSYKWNFGNGKTSTVANPTHTYALSGTYQVTLVTANSCGLDSVKQSVIVSTSGIRNIDRGIEMLITPNPNSGNFILKFAQALNEKSELALYNSVGQMVYSSEVAIGEKELNLAAELSNGVYTVVVKGSSFDMKQRMVISH
jgi:PKD repeat protein